MSNQDRRRFPRVKIQADVQFTILIPTETFSPYSYRGVTLDISMGGICLRTGQIDRDNYLRLIREIRYVKLRLYLPNLDEPLHLRGRVAWWDFHDVRGDQPSFCILGIAFHDFTEEAGEEFRAILSELEDSVSAGRF